MKTKISDLASPIRIFIGILIIILVLMIKSDTYNSNGNWAAGFGYIFIILFIIILTIIELILSFFFKNVSAGKKLFLSTLAIPSMMIILWKTMGWHGKVKNYYYIPKDYKKEYALIIYNHMDGELIKPNYEFPRNRKFKFNKDGLLKIKNSSGSIFSPWVEIRTGNEKKIIHKNNTRISTNGHRFEIYNQSCDIVIFNYDLNTNVDSIKATIDKNILKEFISNDEK